MEQIKEYFEIIDKLRTLYQSDTILQSEITNLSQQTAVFRNQRNTVRILSILNPILDRIQNRIEQVDLIPLTTVQEKILDVYGFSKILGKNFKNYRELIVNNILNEPVTAQIQIQQLTTEINNLRTKPAKILAQIQPISSIEIKPTLKKNEGIIEVTFVEGVSIDNFADAKTLMSDWFLIVDGYSRVLGIQKTDFEIISITKASPTKIKIKSIATGTALALSIVTGLLQLEQRIVGNKVIIEQIRQNPIAQDSAKVYIKDIEKSMKDEIAKEIERLVEEKVKEHKIADRNGDIKTSLKKGIEKQYNFIVNGGEINIYLGESAKNTPEIATLENTKKDIKELKEKYNNLKKIEQNNK